MVFVNGIPLVVVEAKSPLKATARAEEAFEQIKQYERDIPRLFASNAFNIVTDGVKTQYGATGSPSQFYAPWPDAWPRKREEFPDDLLKDIWCLMEPSRLLDLLGPFHRLRDRPGDGEEDQEGLPLSAVPSGQQGGRACCRGQAQEGADLAHPRLGQEPDHGVSSRSS